MKEKEAEQIEHGTNMQGDQRILDRIAKRFKSEVSGFAKASGYIKGTVFYDRQCPPGLCRTFSHRTCLSVAEQCASTMSKHLRSQGGREISELKICFAMQVAADSRLAR